VKSALVANQTLEPTQIAGFNQFFDDTNGTKAQRGGAGLDARVTNNLYAGLEASERDLEVPVFSEVSQVIRAKQKEQLYRGYLYWLPHANWAVRGEYRFEKFSRDPATAGGNPSRIETFSTPLSLNYFNSSGILANFTATYVRQALQRPGPSINNDVSGFVMLDAVLGYRIPNRRGIFSLEGRNLLNNEDSSFRNLNFQVSEQFYSQRFTPGRTFFLRLTLNF
jgi:hypothetical protein